MSYWQFVVSEKNWSWSVVALAWLIVMLIVRHMLLRYIFVQLKKINKDVQQQIQMFYAKQSILGWVLFFMGIASGTLICLNPGFLKNYLSLFQQQAVCVAIFVGSLFAHTTAYANAMLLALGERLGVEKVS